MSKILFLEITCCSQCPYLEKNSDYGMHHDSGWDCHHPDDEVWGRRIIDDGELNALKDHDGPKLTEGTVPDWCPLLDRSDIIDWGSDTMVALFKTVKRLEDVSSEEDA